MEEARSHHAGAVRERAVELRRQGRTREQIRQQLGLPSEWAVTRLLDREAARHPGLRTQAKDDKREQARALRSEGWSYKEIAREIHVSMSSLSLWLRDLPKPQQLPPAVSAAASERRAVAVRDAWQRRRVAGDLARDDAKRAARDQIGSLSDREILVAGAVAYWCEGEKDKPYRRSERVNFINSDPDMIRFFLRFLAIAGVDRSRIRYRVHVHESADLGEVEQYWRRVVQTGQAAFDRPNIKHHNPTTTRKNTAADYRGCLQVRVREGRELYRRIDGWAHAAMGSGG